MKIISTNRKAYHDYIIEETIEAGVSLLGTEIKALREGRGNLKDSYAMAKDGEMYLHNCHISHYSHGNIMNHDPVRTRKLLLHKKEIEKLAGKATLKGYALIPLKIYLNKDGKAKVELSLARGKKQFEKRESIKERESKREIERLMKQR
jgi:SsrA-binding protein